MSMLKRSTRAEAASSRRSFRDLLVVIAPILLVAGVGFVIALQFVKPAPPRHLVMATGPQGGAYAEFGRRYREVLAGYGVELELVPTAGAYENLRLLGDSTSGVEVAFLQGGAGADADEPRPGIESLGSAFYEPVWMFWRGQPPETVREMQGRRVAVGAPDSGTRHAFEYLLKLNGVDVHEFEAVGIGGDDAEAALRAGDVDAACFVASEKAGYVTRLLESEDMAVMPIVRGEAYQRRFRFLATVTLPRGVVDFERDLPREDIPLIALVANIGAREGVHPALIVLLLEAAKQTHRDGDVFAGPGQFPSTSHVVLPMNKGARRYLEKGPPFLQRFLPFWLAIAIDRMIVLLIPLLTLMYPLFKIVPPAYSWRARRKITRYYKDLFGVESRLHDDHSAAEIERCRRQLDDLEERISQITVPVGYGDMLYRLRLHLDFVRDRLEEIAAGHTADRQD